MLQADIQHLQASQSSAIFEKACEIFKLKWKKCKEFLAY